MKIEDVGFPVWKPWQLQSAQVELEDISQPLARGAPPDAQLYWSGKGKAQWFDHLTWFYII